MRQLSVTDAVGTFIDLGRYASSRVRADAEVSALAKVIAVPQAALLKAMGARNAANDALIDREAERDFAADQFNAAMMDLGRQAYAFYGSREEPGYLRLFSKAPSVLAKTPDRDRLLIYGTVLKEAQAPDSPKAFVPTVKKLAEAYKAVQAGQHAVGEAQKAVDKARKAEQSARGDWLAGYRRLHAQLTDRFPRDKPRVEHYFRSAPAPKRKAPAPQPAPSPAAAKA